ncbi:lytic transglycosylase domain-containing protein [Sulfurospirillum sp. 1612]|uniref:lytic transglycosylase domain-containing protein n=1 Tax=Sulfurospirillum sp. 1612 TaxID=3094835 RepID=UPI002F94945E
MLRIILVLVLLIQSSDAFLVTQNNFQEQVKVLKSFDIDSTFLKDKTFISMKDKMNRYRTKHFLKVLEEGNRFVPYLRKLINDSGIPKAFLYLAMAESNFAPNAYSKAKAVGLWQFMPATAKHFGLKINTYVDERKDPIKSTKAAIKYLKYLHNIFGKWYLAAIAYNCGEGTLLKAIKRAKSDNLNVLLNDRKRYLPRESRLYIRKIVMMESLANSADFIIENNSDYLLNGGSAETFAKVEVKQGTSLGAVAASIGLSLKEIRSYNPQLRYDFVPPAKGKYTIYLPYNKQADFKQNYNPKKSNNRFFVYRVKKGDSLHKIARRYGINYHIIKDYNHLKSKWLRIKQALIIPIVKPSMISYTIRKGDTLGKVSHKFNVAINTLIQANNKRNSIIRVGEKLVIPQMQ